MANQDEGLVVGDVVKYEADARYSRKVCTVHTNQTLVLGQICQGSDTAKVLLADGTAAADEIQTITPSVGANVDAVQTITPSVGTPADCVQTITIGGTHSGGTLKLGFRPFGDPNGPIEWTDTIAWNATEATMTASVNTALDDLLGSSEVVCSEIANTAATVLVLTFSGTNATEMVQGLVSVDVSAYTGASTVSVAMTTPGAGAITAGTYRLGITDPSGDVQWTSEIAFDANAAAIITALDDALGVAGVVATGGPVNGPTAVVLTYSGTGYTNLPAKPAQVDFGDLVGCDDVSVVNTTAGSGGIRTDGTYRIGIVDPSGDIQWTAPIAADGNAAAINIAMDDALGVAGVVATGGPVSTPTAVVLTFSGTGYTGLAQSYVVFDLSNLDGCDDVSIAQTTVGGAVVAAGLSANCIILEDVTTVGSTQDAVFLVRQAVVNKDNLTYGTNVTAGEKAAIDAVLEALGIVVTEDTEV